MRDTVRANNEPNDRYRVTETVPAEPAGEDWSMLTEASGLLTDALADLQQYHYGAVEQHVQEARRLVDSAFAHSAEHAGDPSTTETECESCGGPGGVDRGHGPICGGCVAAASTTETATGEPPECGEPHPTDARLVCRKRCAPGRDYHGGGHIFASPDATDEQIHEGLRQVLTRPSRPAAGVQSTTETATDHEYSLIDAVLPAGGDRRRERIHVAACAAWNAMYDEPWDIGDEGCQSLIDQMGAAYDALREAAAPATPQTSPGVVDSAGEDGEGDPLAVTGPAGTRYPAPGPVDMDRLRAEHQAAIHRRDEDIAAGRIVVEGTTSAAPATPESESEGDDGRR